MTESPACFTYLLRFNGGGAYVGISNDPARRLRKYHAKAPSPCGHAIRKHGMPGLVVLCGGTREEMAELERFLIQELDPSYNIAKGGEGAVLRCPEAEQRRRRALSKALTGKRLSKQHREALSRSHKGLRYRRRTPVSSQQRRNMAAAARRRWARDRDLIMEQRQGSEYRDALSEGVKKAWRIRRDRTN